MCLVKTELCEIGLDFLLLLLPHSALQHGSPSFQCYKTNRKQKAKRAERVFQLFSRPPAMSRARDPGCPQTCPPRAELSRDGTSSENPFVKCLYLLKPIHPTTSLSLSLSLILSLFLWKENLQDWNCRRNHKHS